MMHFWTVYYQQTIGSTRFTWLLLWPTNKQKLVHLMILYLMTSVSSLYYFLFIPIFSEIISIFTNNFWALVAVHRSVMQTSGIGRPFRVQATEASNAPVLKRRQCSLHQRTNQATFSTVLILTWQSMFSF